MNDMTELPSAPALHARFDRLFWIGLRDDAITLLLALFTGLAFAGCMSLAVYFGYFRNQEARTTLFLAAAGGAAHLTVKLVRRVQRRMRSRFSKSYEPRR